MKKLGIFLLITILGVLLALLINQMVWSNSIEDAQKRHFENWKESYFFPNDYVATVFDIKHDANQKIVHFKLKDIDNGEYINDGYLCLSTQIKLKDTIYKKRNSYKLFEINHKDTIELVYNFCGKGTE